MPRLLSDLPTFPEIKIDGVDSKKSISTIHIIDESDDEIMEMSKTDPLANLRASLHSFRTRSTTPNTNGNLTMMPPPTMLNFKKFNSNADTKPVSPGSPMIKIKGECHYCGIKIVNNTRLLDHIRRCQNMKIICPVDGCRRRFGWKCKLRDHHRIKHSGERPFHCKECGNDFLTRSHLRQHCNNVHQGFDYNDPDYKEKKYSIVDEYDEDSECKEKVAVNTVNTDVTINKPIPIPSIPIPPMPSLSPVDEDEDTEMLDAELEMKIIRLLLAIKNGNYGKKQSGNDMKRIVRDTQKPWTIGRGGRRGKVDENRKWKCPFCERRYTKKGNMTRHIDHIHETSGEKHACEKCGVMFRQRSALKRHQLTHTKEKKYECGECSFATHWRQNLQRHMVSHHSTL